MPTTILDGETYEQARHRRFTEEAKVIEKIQQDEIIRMAREAGAFRNYFDYGVEGFAFVDDETLERFAALVAAHEREKWEQALPIAMDAMMLQEREACAKVCDEHGFYGAAPARDIRARGDK